MKIALKLVNCKGFLLIECIIALGLLSALLVSLSAYQWQIKRYEQATSEIYQAISFGCDCIEQQLASRQPVSFDRLLLDKYQLTSEIKAALASNCYMIACHVSWQNIWGRRANLMFETVCLCAN